MPDPAIEPPSDSDETRRVLLAEHRKYCADFFCNCRDEDDDDDDLAGYPRLCETCGGTGRCPDCHGDGER